MHVFCVFNKCLLLNQNSDVSPRLLCISGRFYIALFYTSKFVIGQSRNRNQQLYIYFKQTLLSTVNNYLYFLNLDKHVELDIVSYLFEDHSKAIFSHISENR